MDNFQNQLEGIKALDLLFYNYTNEQIDKFNLNKSRQYYAVRSMFFLTAFVTKGQLVPKRALDGKVSLLLPSNFYAMDKALLDIKYTSWCEFAIRTST